MPVEWRCAVVTFGVHTSRTSALAHLVDEQDRALCGVTLAASRPEPADARKIRCERCIQARGAR